MKDIQIGARIPQETSDNLINVVEHMRSIYRGAVVSTSSVVRDAIDVYADMKLNKKIAVSVQALEDKNETYKDLLEELNRLAHDTHNEKIKAFVDGLVKQLNKEIGTIDIMLNNHAIE